MSNVSGTGKVSSPNQDDSQELKDLFAKIIENYRQELEVDQMEQDLEEDLLSQNEEL